MSSSIETIQFLVRDLGLAITRLSSSLKYGDLRLIQKETLSVFAVVYTICDKAKLDPVEIIVKKMQHNSLKYDKGQCQKLDTIKKWTWFSNVTGITRESTPPLVYTARIEMTEEIARIAFRTHYGVLLSIATVFAKERGWELKYTEQSLVLSLLAELGELSEVLQWEQSSEAFDGLGTTIINRFAMELADVLVYMIHLCRTYNVGVTDQVNK